MISEQRGHSISCSIFHRLVSNFLFSILELSCLFPILWKSSGAEVMESIYCSLMCLVTSHLAYPTALLSIVTNESQSSEIKISGESSLAHAIGDKRRRMVLEMPVEPDNQGELIILFTSFSSSSFSIGFRINRFLSIASYSLLLNS
jgi:hypothetical protein